MTGLPDFDTFFHTLWGRDPFPWQTMLAQRVSTGSWPQALDLPTASGKTACIEIALYALAAQADRPAPQRTAPRRIWFVVDRRIVVDEAFDRAARVAAKLQTARDGPLWAVADKLREVARTERPLAVARLRGGILQDQGWARLPSQPAIITSTVDQLGSRLLFRGYGHSLLTAPIFAGLAANDSLVLLDEAHCSVPFLQTLRAIETYRGQRWAEAPLPVPFAFAVLSATPPAEVPSDAIFPGAQRDAALDDPVLHKRLRASKRAALVDVKVTAREPDSALIAAAVERATGYIEDGQRRVGVMVNRVRTAEDVASELMAKLGDEADVVLLTGRMRPFERDSLVERWKPYLRAASPEAPPRPVILVSTQCLEVGADFSFDALVTEAASLDALRQRFGRLDRMGEATASPGAVLIRDRDSDPEKAKPDPIYGTALSATWKLLRDHSNPDHGIASIDFGFEWLRAELRDIEDLSPYLAPASDAPVLLPAHLDMLCQTAPRSEPEPEISLYLHGRNRGAPEVRVLWRADLAANDTDPWIETIALCPPVSGEMLSVPLYRLISFLAASAKTDDSGDVEGVPSLSDDEPSALRPCLVWRGRDRSKIAEHPDDLVAGDIVVLPADYGFQGLGQVAGGAFGDAGLDLWELVLAPAGRPAAVRVNRAVLSPWLPCPAVHGLLTWAEGRDRDRAAMIDAIEAVLAYEPEPDGGAEPPPKWWVDMLREVGSTRFRIEEHPACGVVLVAHSALGLFGGNEPDVFADDDDLTSVSDREVTLDEHSELVERTVRKLAVSCLPGALEEVLSLAAAWHDAGKLDERFQVLLRHGDELAAASGAAPLAKSALIPVSPGRRRAIRQASGLPSGFRHELLSAILAGRHAPIPEDPQDADLVLHLIASHHGHGRPFAPVCDDPTPPPVIGRLGAMSISLSAAERSALPPAHRIDSGHSDRFWRLVRRHGWWGLAYLEAVLRLGDWYASRLFRNDQDERGKEQ
ncbi:MAG: type I-U CRISPR-associated helicase/endonuclease Cas3 [Acidobacteria bacterium]|nr:type I-U CRISPR-associated helicase/endonuclease Cas3 [Acidobacteriota bacterium]